MLDPTSVLSDPLNAVLSLKELKDFTKDASQRASAARLDTLWVFVAGALVMLMQAGFLLLEAGFSRMKNAGTIVAKVIANLSIAGDRLLGGRLRARVRRRRRRRRTTGWFAGNERLLPPAHRRRSTCPAMSFSDATIGSKFFFQFAFCAVSLAIVWGTTLERIKFGAYLIYAVFFAALIYPLGSHWIFGGGWLQANFGMQDFAGSTVIHLIGATGGARRAAAARRRARASTGPTAGPTSSPGTRCRWSASA